MPTGVRAADTMYTASRGAMVISVVAQTWSGQGISTTKQIFEKDKKESSTAQMCFTVGARPLGCQGKIAFTLSRLLFDICKDVARCLSSIVNLGHYREKVYRAC